MPNIFSDHSALILIIRFDEETAPRGPGYWRFNYSLLSDEEYVALLRSKIPEFVEKYKQVEDKGLFWEMVKMEIRGLTIPARERGVGGGGGLAAWSGTEFT